MYEISNNRLLSNRLWDQLTLEQRLSGNDLCIWVERHQIRCLTPYMVTLRRFTDLKRVYGREWLWATWTVGTRVGRGPRAHTYDPHVLTSTVCHASWLSRLYVDGSEHYKKGVLLVRSLQTRRHPCQPRPGVLAWSLAHLPIFIPDKRVFFRFQIIQFG